MSKPLDILLVEDSPGDAKLTIKALEQGCVRNRVHHVRDGVYALEFLQHRGSTASVRPDLILLDLNLPRKDGRELLAEIKVDPELRRIPVVILTTSQAEEDVVRSYDLHANCFVNKPLDFESFLGVIASIERFWFSTVNLPPN